MKLATATCVVLLSGSSFAWSAATQAPSKQHHPAELVTLTEEFRDWRRAEPGEVPDYVKRVEEQNRGLAEFRQRLASLAPRDWPIHAQVDYLMLLIEMNALEFDLNVIRQVSRNPDFYTIEAVNGVRRNIGRRYQMGPRVTVPYDAGRAAAIIKALDNTSAIVEQAPNGLTEAVPEMADMALERLEDVQEGYAEFAKVVGPHLPEPYRSQIGPAAERAGAALTKYARWIEQNRSGMTAPYVIGRPALDWHVQRVKAMPFDSDDLLMQGEMERNRNWAFLQFERQKNSHLPSYGGVAQQPLRPAKSKAEYSEWKDATDVLTRMWGEELELFTRPDYLGPMRQEDGMVWIEPFEDMAFPSEPKPQGTKTEFVGGPDFWHASIYSEVGHYLDPGVNHVHSDYPGHTFERAVSQKTTCELRRRHNTRGDAWCYYIEELQLQLDYPFVRGPRAREWMYSLGIWRAERLYLTVLLADGSMTPKQAEQHMLDNVPWMETYVARRHETWRKFVRPTHTLTYQVGKFEVYKLLMDRMRQLGEGFKLRDFHDALLATGQIPISFARWEMTGNDEDVKHLWEAVPIPGTAGSSSR